MDVKYEPIRSRGGGGGYPDLSDSTNKKILFFCVFPKRFTKHHVGYIQGDMATGGTLEALPEEKEYDE